MIKLSTAILVGGKSRRMKGQNKSFLTYENQTFIERILGQLEAFDETLISVRDSQKYEEFPNLVEDEVKDIGPLGGLYTCLKQCENEYLFVCATDMPLLKKELIDYMLEFISSDYDCFVIQSANKTHPLCGIYKKSMLPIIKQMINNENYRLMHLLDQVRVKYISLSYTRFEESVVANINRPEDLLSLKRPPIFCVSGVKNSGKTTLVTKLIKAFKGEGYSVGVIKHDGHEFEIDIENTDTYKHRQAGSDGTIIYSSTKYALIKSWKNVEVSLLINLLQDLDLIIIEGMKHSVYPKIEVVRETPVCDPRYTFAIATDGDFHHETMPTVSRDDIPALMTLIKREIGEKHDNKQ